MLDTHEEGYDCKERLLKLRGKCIEGSMVRGTIWHGDWCCNGTEEGFKYPDLGEDCHCDCHDDPERMSYRGCCDDHHIFGDDSRAFTQDITEMLKYTREYKLEKMWHDGIHYRMEFFEGDVRAVGWSDDSEFDAVLAALCVANGGKHEDN